MTALAIIVLVFFGLTCLSVVPAARTEEDFFVGIMFVLAAVTMSLGLSLAIVVLT